MNAWGANGKTIQTTFFPEAPAVVSKMVLKGIEALRRILRIGKTPSRLWVFFIQMFL
jgi:hypothetical protein